MGAKKLKLYFPPKFSKVCCPTICSIKNFPFRSFVILTSYWFWFLLWRKNNLLFGKNLVQLHLPPPPGVWFWVKSVCHPGGVGTVFFYRLCYHFLTKPRLTGVHSLKALFKVIITEYMYIKYSKLHICTYSASSQIVELLMTRSEVHGQNRRGVKPSILHHLSF